MSSHTDYHWLLRRADQSVVAALVLLSLTAIGGWRFAGSGRSDRFVEADHCPRQTASFQVDINTADLPELLQLPGIGNTLAGRIIASRKTDGPFASRDELVRIRGIGPKIMERVKPYLLPLPGDKQCSN
jgi:competence protein ComEA